MTRRQGIVVGLMALAIAIGAPGGARALAGEPGKEAPGKGEPGKEPAEKEPPQPFHVWADRIHYIQEQSLARMTGNVTIIKGDMRIDADSVVADIEEATNQFKKMTATGNVRVYTIVPVVQRTLERPPLQLTPEGRRATCDRATYDSATDVVVLYGTPEKQPVAYSGNDEIKADVITYDKKKLTMLFEGKVQLDALIPAKSETPETPPGKEAPPKEPAP